MKILRTLLPGRPGTKKLTDQYGDSLVCVRYRYDSLHHQRMTTVEIIIDQESWHLNSARIPPNKLMDIRIEYGERELAQQVKSLGGRWNRQRKAWELQYRIVQRLKLEDRIISKG